MMERRKLLKNKGDKKSEMEKRLRHVVNTDYLSTFNECLSPMQKECILRTPFKSLIKLKKKIKISGVLVRELVHRWDIHSKGFRVGDNIIPFTLLDVSFGLGLRIHGEAVYVDDGNDSRVKQLFDGGAITVSTIIEKMGDLTHDENVEDFCRLYILLAFETLYFPKTTREVHSLPFRLLNDLGSLSKYNWGGEVYRVLVGSLHRVAPRLNEGKTKDSLYIAGCAALLQLWAVDHLSLRPTSEKTKFPRILDWVDVGTGKCIVAKIFDQQEVVEDLPINDEDRRNEVLKEAIENLKKDRLPERKTLLERQKEFGVRLSMLEEELKVCVEGDDKRASTSNFIVESQDIPHTSYGPNVGRRATRSYQKSMLDLFHFCTRRPTKENEGEVLVDINGYFLDRKSLSSLGPKKWVDNFVFGFISPMMMLEEMNRRNVVRRFIFNSYLGDKVIAEVKRSTQLPWSLADFLVHHNHPGTAINSLRSCNLIFAPVVYKGHWTCYGLDKHRGTMYVLDPLQQLRNKELVEIDSAMCNRFGELLRLIHPKKGPQKCDMWFSSLPKQHNTDDCGMYVLKYMELWNPETTMPDYSVDEILQFRQEFVWKWVLDKRNIYIKKVLAEAKLSEDLKYTQP